LTSDQDLTSVQNSDCSSLSACCCFRPAVQQYGSRLQ